MSNFHISEDGVARQCKAQSPSTCRATKEKFEQHYETASEAQQAYQTQQMENLFNTIEKESLDNQTARAASVFSNSLRKTKHTNKNILTNEQIDEENFAKRQNNFNKIKLNVSYSKRQMMEFETELDENSAELNKRIKNSLSKKELLKHLEYRSNNVFNILYNHANLENYYAATSKAQEYRKKKSQDKRKVMKIWREEHKVIKKFIKQASQAHEENPTRETRNELISLKSRAETLEDTIYDMKRGIFSWD